MLKIHVFRLGNSLLLGLIVLMGAVFFQSNGAQAQDKYGTNCPPDWSYISGFCFGGETYLDTGMTSCASDYSGRMCCTYEGFKVVCAIDPSTTVGSAYQLKYAGQAGYCNSNNSQCVLI